MNVFSHTSFSVPQWFTGLKEDYQSLLVKEWSPYVGAILLVILSAVLMTSGLFWGVFGGLKLLGNWFNELIGLAPILGISSDLDNPLMHRISLMNITLVLGAFCAALLAGHFRFNRPPPQEYVTGAFGGILMGMGATLAGGCTTGGFFTPLLFSSPAGWAMWAGLLAGAYIGLKMLLWTMEHVTWGTQAPAVKESVMKPYFPIIGLLVLVLLLLWAESWFQSDNAKLASRAIIIVTGFAIGFTLNRSRFCLSRVFREPFMTGEGTMTKAMIMALAIGIPVASVLLQRGMPEDPYLAIPATFWIGSALGGLLFGIGMIFAGGCASGSLWRMGEGHIKSWVAVFFFAWSGSTFSAILNKWGILTREMTLELVEVTKVGSQAYLPEWFGGWGWVYLFSFIILLIWYLLVRYNESSERFPIF